MSAISHPEPVLAPPALAIPYRLLAAGTIFLGSFLLFQIQPVIAKQVLPWFGGAASVWTTCLLFFQTVLFLGYVYAHVLNRWLPARKQAAVHIGLMLVSLAALPAIPDLGWKPAGQEDPVLRILGLLATTIGLPYFLLSATSPLVQSWLSRDTNVALPYRFYALSNAASLGALLAYPVLVEPLMPTGQQAFTWSVLYACFVALCGTCAWIAPAAVPVQLELTRPPRRRQLLWLVLAAFPSLLSLAVTNHLCQNVASIPFLWILPLGVYLLSLMLCFDGDGWYRRKLCLPLWTAAIAAASWVLLHESPDTAIRLSIPFFTALLFLACMYFHGELAARKPDPRWLTQYYLVLSLGGALGAMLVAAGAPYWLRGNYEFPLALGACAFLTLMLEYRKHWLGDIVLASVTVAVVASTTAVISEARSSAILSIRSFYGGLRIADTGTVRTMVHGTVSHGSQLRARPRHATTYYAPGSGVEQAIEAFRKPNMRVGVVGLGAGTLAAYARTGDEYQFYEINPQVAELARTHFTYLSGSPARTQITLGDGRLTLERQSPRRFDILVVDAFSGDSIPVHLLSREAFAVYYRHLAPGGVLALHVSNSALNLVPVAERIAQVSGRASLHIHAGADASLARSESDWVLVGEQAALESRPAFMAAGKAPSVRPSFPVWTDDYSNLFRVLK